MVPDERVASANAQPLRPAGDYVLYWMIGNRRPYWNQALEHAVAHASRMAKPLLIIETVRIGYQWASQRMHAFMLAGMADNAAAFAPTAATYVPWIEERPETGIALLVRLAARACVVVTDEFPCFILPLMVVELAAKVEVRVEAVDANGILPLRATDKAYDRAYDFRRMLQKTLRPHLGRFPVEDPLRGVTLPRLKTLPTGLQAVDPGRDLSGLPFGSPLAPGRQRGGWKAAQATLDAFLTERLDRYAEDRSDFEFEAASGLSPYLHFGHLSVHQVLATLWSREEWSPQKLGLSTAGSKEDWWGMSVNAESFIDELITWRELGYHFCFHRPHDYDRYESLPAWAQKTLDEHAGDPRPHLYSAAQLEQAATHDPLWNAAQRQLVTEGRMHNYLRMLWGKKVLEWSAHPREALDTLIELNNRYALDGCNPNSYSGIFWCLGRFDRPWAPQRPIFGCIRYMSSDNTARKFRVKGYLARYARSGQQSLW